MTLGGYHMGGDGDAQVAVQAGGHRGRDRRRPAVGLIFKRIWKVVGRGSDAPAPLDSERGWGEVLLASVLQGAIYALVKTAVDRGAAEWTRKQTGIWPAGTLQHPGRSSDHHKAEAAARTDE